jgi:hypothetical protein
MSHDTTEHGLCVWLAKHRQYARAIHLPVNRATGLAKLGRGFAFVDFAEDNGARNAMGALTGCVVEGHTLDFQVIAFEYSAV